MKLSELYIANENWTPMVNLVLVDEDLTIIESGMEAYLADIYYGNREVKKFKGILVILKNLKEGKPSE